MKTIRHKGYTLSEIMVAIIILGIMSSLALPSYNIQMAKIKSQEATIALQSIYLAQKEYKKDNLAYATSLADLDVSFPGGLNNFNNPIALDEDIICNGVTRTRVGVIIRIKNPKYELSILETGQIICRTLPSLSCSDPLCEKLGFSNTWQ